MAPQEDEVLALNEAFYRAFAGRDEEAMDAIWARSLPVACIHPGWPALRGRDKVMASWRGVLSSPTSPSIRCIRATAHVLEDAAFVVCYELIPGTRLAATNVYAREDGAWRMVHHQAGPVARPEEDDDDEPEPPDPGTLN